MNEGATFSDGSNLYFYGGYVTRYNERLDSPPPVATWKYSIESGNWTSDGFEGAIFQRMAEGATAQSSVHKKAYYLGGEVDTEGNPALSRVHGASPYSVSGLVVLDQNTLEWSNISSEGLNEYGTLNNGYMNLIEDFGNEGILVTFGGNTHPIGQGLDILAQKQDSPDLQNPMESISIYDIANGKWHTQKSTGNVPHWRMAGCTVVAAAPDLSSFSIYVFGGMLNSTATSDGDVYVLSLPSFRWIRVVDGNDLRIEHKCQLAGKHTMLVIGGLIPYGSQEFKPKPSNCDSGTFQNGIGIFDLNEHDWLFNYDADGGEYKVHKNISDVIGGSTTGGATVTQPEDGFGSTDLANLFKNKKAVVSSSASPSSTFTANSDSSSNSSSISKGGIAGATVGAVAGAAALGDLAFFVIAYKRRRAAKQNLDTADLNGKVRQPHLAELHGHERPVELGMSEVAEMSANNVPPQELPADISHTRAEMDGSQSSR